MIRKEQLEMQLPQPLGAKKWECCAMHKVLLGVPLLLRQPPSFPAVRPRAHPLFVLSVPTSKIGAKAVPTSEAWKVWWFECNWPSINSKGVALSGSVTLLEWV